MKFNCILAKGKGNRQRLEDYKASAGSYPCLLSPGSILENSLRADIEPIIRLSSQLASLFIGKFVGKTYTKNGKQKMSGINQLYVGILYGKLFGQLRTYWGICDVLVKFRIM